LVIAAESTTATSQSRRDPVGDDAADQHQRDQDDAVSGKDDAEVGRRAGQVEHREGERDRRYPLADQRGGAAGEQPPVGRFPEHPQFPSRCHTRQNRSGLRKLDRGVARLQTLWGRRPKR